MKTTLLAFVAGSLFCAPLSRAEENRAAVKPDRISLFTVPLQCPAAPEIGCGSKAKPILAALERDSTIAEAWLNKAGTVLAVVGAENSTPESRLKTVQSVLEKREVKATGLKGVARDTALKDFESRAGWYRGGEVDQLSRQEAGIIAARLVRRLQTKVSLSDEKARALEAEFTDVFKKRFTGNPDQSKETPLDQRNDELLKAAREHLDEKGVEALKESLASGLRPGPNEK
jgi:hypothetical protein